MNSYQKDILSSPKKSDILDYNKKFVSGVEDPSFNSLVSIIICNRNGLNNLINLFNSLKNSQFYNNYELIIVDNASVDESIIYIDEQKDNYSIRLIRNKKNETFSKACNQGAEIAEGEYLLFLNNDIEVTDYWLDELLKVAIKKKNVGAIGAKLIYPEIPENTTNFGKDYKIQHAGIAFHRQSYEGDQYIRPYNKGNGKDPFSDNEKTIAISAVTAACLLMKRDVFINIGGFDEHYIYGYEDVDLCLKALRKGYVNFYCPTALLFHYEFGTQQNDLKNEVYLRRKANLLYFTRRWNDFLRQRILRDKLSREYQFSEKPLTIAFVLKENLNNITGNGSIARFADALIREGCTVKFLIYDNEKDKDNWYNVGYDTDILVSTSYEYDISKIQNAGMDIITVAWLTDNLKAWCSSLSFHYYTFVLTETETDSKYVFYNSKRVSNFFSKKPTQLIDLIKTCNYQFENKIAILIPVPNREEAEWWGDYHFAKALQKCFENKGYIIEIRFSSEWDQTFNGKYVIVLRGLNKYTPKMIHFNMMWNLSHPDIINVDEYDEYDVNFISSEIWADFLKTKVKTHVSALLQCSDVEVFTGEKHYFGETPDILFVGNTRNVFRESIRYLLPTEHKLSVYGKGWDNFIDPQYIKGIVIPNKDLNNYYSNCKILLNDHWEDMKQKGFISNRIFDGLAAGAFIISDNVEGLDDELKECIVTYQDETDFKEKIEYYLTHPDERKEMALKGQELVRKKHTFQKRVDQIIDVMNTFFKGC